MQSGRVAGNGVRQPKYRVESQSGRSVVIPLPSAGNGVQMMFTTTLHSKTERPLENQTKLPIRRMVFHCPMTSPQQKWKLTRSPESCCLLLRLQLRLSRTPAASHLPTWLRRRRSHIYVMCKCHAGRPTRGVCQP